VESCQPTGVHAGLADLLARYNVNDYAASVRVYALKPPSGPDVSFSPGRGRKT
jgi:hypothetical protein